ncbi:hypothetical protein ACGF13_02795 [Kitasatospora sp. NPDC048286]|uniref:hypothetical protein n=1 Tax=Kitasatospora sp. NPDC048286 TaxID=3364047 RepID=UPI00372026F4
MVRGALTALLAYEEDVELVAVPEAGHTGLVRRARLRAAFAARALGLPGKDARAPPAPGRRR